MAKFEPLPGYSNLEYDLTRGVRGKRDVHATELIERPDLLRSVFLEGASKGLESMAAPQAGEGA